MSHPLPYEVNCSILFTELPLLERPAAARRPASTPSSSGGRSRRRCPPTRTSTRSSPRSRTPACSSSGSTSSPATCRAATAAWCRGPARAAEFRDNIDVTVGIGERLGCKAFNALYGNRVDDATPQEQDDLGAENLALAAKGAARIGGTVLVEPVSGAPPYPLLTAADALAVDRPGRRAERRPARRPLPPGRQRRRRRHGHRRPRRPDRARPDRRRPRPRRARHRSLPLLRQLADLRAAGYAGWVGLEYKPSGASADSFGWI